MHIYVPFSTVLWTIFLNLSDIYKKLCAQTFPPIIELFTIFDHYLPKIVVPPRNKNEKYLAHLKGQSLMKKTLKMASKSTHKQWHKTYSKYTPSNEQRTTKDKHPIFTPTASGRCTIFLNQTLHGDRARWDHQKDQWFFDPTHSFSYRVHRKIRPKWPTHGSWQ